MNATATLAKLNEDKGVLKETDELTPRKADVHAELKKTVQQKEDQQKSIASRGTKREVSPEDLESKRLKLEHQRLSNRLEEIRLAKAENANKPDVLEELSNEEQEKTDALAELQQRKRDATLQGKAINIVERANNQVATAANKVASLKTVGGIGLLIVVLVVLLFIVVQVNAEGDTRLKQLWAMINGKAQLIGHVDIQRQNQTYAGGQAVVYGSNQNGGANDTLSQATGGILQRHDDMIPTPFGTIDIPDFRLNI